MNTYDHERLPRAAAAYETARQRLAEAAADLRQVVEQRKLEPAVPVEAVLLAAQVCHQAGDERNQAGDQLRDAILARHSYVGLAEHSPRLPVEVGPAVYLPVAGAPFVERITMGGGFSLPAADYFPGRAAAAGEAVNDALTARHREIAAYGPWRRRGEDTLTMTLFLFRPGETGVERAVAEVDFAPNAETVAAVRLPETVAAGPPPEPAPPAPEPAPEPATS